LQGEAISRREDERRLAQEPRYKLQVMIVDAGLKKGQIVLSGSFTRPVDIRAGDVIHADYGPLGAIGVSFT